MGFVLFSVSPTAAMPKTRTRHYTIEMRDADGVVLFSEKAAWTDRERRIAFAHIERLARLPEANVNGERALQPQPKAPRRPARGSERLPR